MDRVLDRLEQLYAISATRIGDSAEEDAAHRLAARWMREAGLEVEVDAAGNTIGRRGDGRVWIGSHLDSVPDGGRFDGALGVVAAIELAERLDVPLAVVAFRDEERGCAGSSACVAAGQLAGGLPRAARRAGPGARARERADRDRDRDRRHRPRRGRLRGPRRPRGHDADGRPRRRAAPRRPSSCCTSRARRWPGTVATVGRLAVEPGAVNVVPARVTLSVEARAADGAELDRLVAAIGFEPTYRAEPAAMSGAAVRGAQGRRARTRPSSSPARATTRRSSPPPASRPGCSSSAA